MNHSHSTKYRIYRLGWAVSGKMYLVVEFLTNCLIFEQVYPAFALNSGYDAFYAPIDSYGNSPTTDYGPPYKAYIKQISNIWAELGT